MSEMISYIKGPITAIEGDQIVVEAGPVGLAGHVPLSVLDGLPGIGQIVTVYTYFQVKEDGMALYGFLTHQDRDMFRQLIGVSGIGPKGGLGILSALTPDDLRFAVMAGDVKAISAAPGIGKKTAEKLILELKDKLHLEDALEHAVMEDSGPAAAPGHMGDAQTDAVQALVALGYGSTEALKAVRQVEWTDGMDAEDLLKQALKYMVF